MGRERGYYWVRLKDGWRIASWDGSEWWMDGVEITYSAYELLEIDERRLVRPDEVK